MKTFLVILSASSVWFTTDQLGQKAFREENYGEAAGLFEDPMWKGTALFRDGEFKLASQVFARVDSAEAHYNRGNCFVFMGKYQEAVASYDRALKRRPGWEEAMVNREVAAIRGEKKKREGGDMGDQKLGADKVVFDKRKAGGQDTEVKEGGATSNSAMQEMWLRRVQTKPADFLRSKFAYQQRRKGEEAEE